MTSEAKGIDFLKQAIAKKRFPKVLVVEDDVNDYELTAMVLRQFECEYVWAASAEDAIQLIEEDGITLVLLDVKLPVVPGVEVLTQTMGINPDMHFVVVTGCKGCAQVDEAIRRGAVLVLEKPITYEKLAAFLNPKQHEHGNTPEKT